MAERLIRESDVLENIDEWLETVGYATIGKNLSYYAELKGCIEDAPTIDAKPVVHAHWFLLDDCANEGVYCSACTKKVYKTDYANQKLKSKYCPNCGAQMDENHIAEVGKKEAME